MPPSSTRERQLLSIRAPRSFRRESTPSLVRIADTVPALAVNPLWNTTTASTFLNSARSVSTVAGSAPVSMTLFSASPNGPHQLLNCAFCGRGRPAGRADRGEAGRAHAIAIWIRRIVADHIETEFAFGRFDAAVNFAGFWFEITGFEFWINDWPGGNVAQRGTQDLQ